MYIDLSREEIARILKEKFGEDAQFHCVYVESDRLWEARNGKKISDEMKPPEKETYSLHFEE